MFLNILLLVVLSISVYTDLKSRRIYNKLIYPSLILAMITHLIINGFDGFVVSLIGFLVGLSLLILPFFLGGIGAGDVKLLALIGALKGWVFVLYTGIYMAIIGGVMALMILAFGKGMFKKFAIFLYGLKNRHNMSYLFNRKKTYPYGVAIALGAILAFILEGRVTLW
jgi:prepilin peptidase CpaA